MNCEGIRSAIPQGNMKRDPKAAGRAFRAAERAIANMQKK